VIKMADKCILCGNDTTSGKKRLIFHLKGKEKFLCRKCKELIQSCG